MAKVVLPLLTVKRICAISRINNNTLRTTHRSDRSHWAFAIKLVGRSVYQWNGNTCVSDSSHLVILPKGTTYKVSYEEFGECFIVEFEADYAGDDPEITGFSIGLKHDFVNKVTGLERLWTFKKPAYELFCISGLYELMAKLHETEFSDYYSSSKYKVIEPAIKYLEENYANPDLSSEEMAFVSGISCVYFRKIFSTVFGQSPMKFLQSVRMEKAKDMLSSESMPITDIAESVGFKSIYHFSKTFKKTTGYTPTEYAKRNQK